MKKMLAFLLAAMLMVSLAACGSKTCKESGCDEPVYQDGYCETHYALHVLEDALGGLFE